MNIGKLLAAGKSVVNGRGSISYRPGKISMPKFGSAKNPFVAPVQTELPQPPANPVPVAPMGKISGSPKSLATWTTKLNPMTMLRGSEEKTFSRPIVQSELSLDSVKVVHNDLTDADVEIIPMKSRPAREVPDLKPAKQAWEILGERLLRATAL